MERIFKFVFFLKEKNFDFKFEKKKAGFDAENFFKQNNLPKNLRPHQASPEIFLKLFDMIKPIFFNRIEKNAHRAALLR